MNTHLISIDPGSNGGAVWWRDGEAQQVLRLKKTPKQKYFTTQDLHRLRLMSEYLRGDISLVIEEPFLHKPPKQSMINHCTTWACFGQLVACVPYNSLTVVKAKEWKGRMDLSSNKESSLEMARELFPQFADALKFKACDGVAEALLIGVDYVNRQ